MNFAQHSGDLIELASLKISPSTCSFLGVAYSVSLIFTLSHRLTVMARPDLLDVTGIARPDLFSDVT